MKRCLWYNEQGNQSSVENCWIISIKYHSLFQIKWKNLLQHVLIKYEILRIWGVCNSETKKTNMFGCRIQRENCQMLSGVLLKCPPQCPLHLLISSAVTGLSTPCRVLHDLLCNSLLKCNAEAWGFCGPCLLNSNNNPSVLTSHLV